MRALIAATGLTGLLLLPVLAVAPSASAYGSDRMQLDCADGRTIERSNGSSWWGQDGTGYVTEQLLVSDDSGVLFEKHYGNKGNGERSSCVGHRFGTTWTVDLVRSR